MAEMSNSDPQFEVYKKRLFDEVAKENLAMIKALAKKNPELLNSLYEKRWTVLHVAACWRKLNAIEWLLSDEGRAAGFNSVLAKVAEGDLTALHISVLRGDLECFKAIVEGCKVENGEREQMLNAVDEGGSTVLHFAAWKGSISIAQWLLSDEKGGGREAGFNSVLVKGRKGNTSLHHAAGRGDLECFKAIVYGCKVENGEREQMLNGVDDHGRTVLHSAVAMESTSIIKWLLSDEKGGGREAGFNNILARGKKQGFTALHLAAQYGNLECFVAIVEGCRVENGEGEKMLNAVTTDGYTVLHFAADLGHVSIIKWLMSKGRDHGFTGICAKGSKGETALHVAAFRGYLEACKAIMHGCKVGNGERELMLNDVDEEGYTVLHCATQQGHSSIIKWLMSKGRDLGFAGIISKDCQDALLATAKGGYLEACKAIVEGCTVTAGERMEMLNAVTIERFTALHVAAAHGHSSVVSWLLSEEEGGGRAMRFESVLKITEKEGGMALHLAAQYGHLDACKAIVNGCRVENGEREEMVNAVDKDGFTVLHYATGYGHANIVSWLLTHDADGGRANGLKSETITSPAILSQCSLHCVAQSGSVETLRALLSGCTVGERLKMFLAVDEKGWTPLHWAAGFCRLDIIRELLLHHEETKMIVDHRDHQGMTALHCAVLDGGFYEQSKKRREELGIPDDPNLPPREEVAAALLTCEYDDEEEEEEDDEYDQITSSIDRRSKHQQQAAFIDVNAGLKIEK